MASSVVALARKLRGKSKGATRDLNRVCRHRLWTGRCSFVFVDVPVREDILSSNHSTHHLQVDYKRGTHCLRQALNNPHHHKRGAGHCRFAFEYC